MTPTMHEILIHINLQKTIINDNPPKDLNIILKIMEILITKGNLILLPKETTDDHLNDLSRKRKPIGAATCTPTRGSNSILPIVISIMPCSPVSS